MKLSTYSNRIADIMETLLYVAWWRAERGEGAGVDKFLFASFSYDAAAAVPVRFRVRRVTELSHRPPSNVKALIPVVTVVAAASTSSLWVLHIPTGDEHKGSIQR